MNHGDATTITHQHRVVRPTSGRQHCKYEKKKNKNKNKNKKPNESAEREMCATEIKVDAWMRTIIQCVMCVVWVKRWTKFEWRQPTASTAERISTMWIGNERHIGDATSHLNRMTTSSSTRYTRAANVCARAPFVCCWHSFFLHRVSTKAVRCVAVTLLPLPQSPLGFVRVFVCY